MVASGRLSHISELRHRNRWDTKYKHRTHPANEMYYSHNFHAFLACLVDGPNDNDWYRFFKFMLATTWGACTNDGVQLRHLSMIYGEHECLCAIDVDI